MNKLMIVCKHLSNKNVAFEILKNKPINSKDSGITAICFDCLDKSPSIDFFYTICEHCFRKDRKIN